MPLFFAWLIRALARLGEPSDREAQTEVARILTGLAWVYFFQGPYLNRYIGYYNDTSG